MANMVASLIHTISAHTSDVTCVAFTHDKLATCSGDKTIRLWSIDDFSEYQCSPLLGHTYCVQCCTFSPFGTMLASCSTDGKLILWDVKTGDQLGVLQHPSKLSLRICRFSPNSARIVSGSDDDNLCLWEVSTRKLIRTFSGHDESVVACAFSPDSHYIVSGSVSGDLRIWDGKFGHGRCLAFELDGHDLGVTCCDFSQTYGTADKPDAAVANFLLATGGKDNLIKLWEFTAEVGSPAVLLKLRDTLPGHADTIMCCSFSPKGDVLASGSLDKSIRLWNPLNGTPLFTVEGHSRYVTSCAFSVDGTLLASGSNDRTVMVWKLTNTSKIMAGLSGYEEPAEQSSSEKDTPLRGPLVAVEKWSGDEVCAWLVSIGMEQYQETFHHHAIDGSELLCLSSDDLEKSLGIAPLGHRNKILRSRGHIEQHSSVQKKEPVSDDGIPDEYLCPVTREIMKDPVMASDGYTYDRSAIKSWIESGKDRSPMTNSILAHKTLTPNRTLKMLIQRYLQGSS